METKFKRAALPVFFCIFVWLLLDLWRCPALFLTGIPCPGCGMTRALLALLKGDLAGSFFFHPMLLPTAAAFILGLLFWLQKKDKALKKVLWVWAVCMLICWGMRLIFVFPNPPMSYEWNSLAGTLIRSFQAA